MTDIPYVDLSAIERLRSIEPENGDIFVCDIIDLYLKHFPASLASLEASLIEQDFQKIFRAAHQLRGLCLNVGAIRMAEACRAFESKELPIDPCRSNALLMELRTVSEETARELSQIQLSRTSQS